MAERIIYSSDFIWIGVEVENEETYINVDETEVITIK